MPAHGEPADAIIEALARDVSPGLMAMPGPRFFGFVIGGSLPAALAADWLTSAWDQNAPSAVSSPAAAAVETIAAHWLVELLGLPGGTSVGFTTGATMANFTGLAAARDAVLRRVGWDVEADGLHGGPRVSVVIGEDAHVTVFLGLRMLGFGEKAPLRVAADQEGRMRLDALRTILGRTSGPTIVCLQAGNVNSGSFDPLAAAIAVVREVRPDAWIHIDGAFGLWAAAVPSLRHRIAGYEGADSWSTDAHKWLNVPYDCGLVFVRDPEAHRAAMGMNASYLPFNTGRRARPRRLRPGAVAARARLPGLRGAALARPVGGRGARRALLRAGASVRGRAGRRSRHGGPQRGRAQPGAGPLRRFGRSNARRGGPAPGRRHRLVRGRHLARQGGHADLGQQLVDPGGRRRPLARRDPALPGGLPAGRVRMGAESGEAGWEATAARQPAGEATAGVGRRRRAGDDDLGGAGVACHNARLMALDTHAATRRTFLVGE